MRQLPIGKTVYKVNDFLSWQRGGSLVLSPSFQRRPVWKPAAKSFLLDSIVRGLPVPIIFIRERSDLQTLEPIREVVDGQQRLRTILSFVEPSSIKDYQEARDFFTINKNHNKELSGLTFPKLPTDSRRAILNYEFSVHTLPADTDDREILQIFARLNSTGVKLNAQEIRNAEFIGPFKNRMYDLAYEQLARWREWGIFSENEIARMQEVELTSDLAYVILYGLTAMNQTRLRRVYNEFENEFPDQEEVSTRFRAVMDEIERVVGSEIRTLAYSRKALFQTLFTLFYDLMFGLGSGLSSTKARKVDTALRSCLAEASALIRAGELPETLAKVLRGATSHLEARSTRLAFVREICGLE